MKTKLTLIVVGILTLFTTSVTYAVNQGGIGGSPAYPDPENPRTKSIFVYNLNLGESKNDGIQIFNNTDQTKVIDVYAVDSQTSSGGSLACAQQVDAKKDVGSWVTLEKTQITLGPNQKETIPFVITVPEKADVGEHDGCMVIQDATDVAKSSNGVTLSFRSALRMIVTIPGEIFKKLSYKGLTHSINDKGELIVHTAIENEGNVSADVNVRVTLASIYGRKIAENGGGYPVLPRTTAEWNFDVKRPFWGGVYKIATSSEYHSGTSDPIGREQGDKTNMDGPTKIVILEPKPLAAVLEFIIVVIAAYLGYRYYKKSHKTRHAKRTWVKYRVRSGDSLSAIAANRNVKWQELAKLNNIKPPYHLSPGQIIIIPPKGD